MAQIESPEALARMDNPHHRLLTELIINTGLRIGDAITVRQDCVVRDNVREPYLHYTNNKMRREALVPIDEGLAQRILAQAELARSIAPGTPWLFPATKANPDGRRHLSTSGYRGGLTAWLAALEVKDESGNPAVITPHQFRHTLGTRLINNEVPQHIVQKLLDHSTPEMTARYARLMQATVRREWNKARAATISGTGFAATTACSTPPGFATNYLARRWPCQTASVACHPNAHALTRTRA